MKDQITNSVRQAVSGMLILALAFMIFEPAIGRAVEDQFTVTQTITSEISFLVPATDIVMSPNLAGITGGTSNGSTELAVLTNNATGYNMTLKASSSVGMIGNTQGGNIPAYTPSTPGVPDYDFAEPTNAARFGYTVEAATAADVAPLFKDNGSDCNSGSNVTADQCWLNASTTAVTIINRNNPTLATGATTTLKFRVFIDSNPSPAIPQDVYVATTTLTATAN